MLLSWWCPFKMADKTVYPCGFRLIFHLVGLKILWLQSCCSPIMQCCGSASTWCGSESGRRLPNKKAQTLKKCSNRLISIHFCGLSSVNWWGSTRIHLITWCGSGSYLSIWCGSGSARLLYCTCSRAITPSPMSPMVLVLYVLCPLFSSVCKSYLLSIN